jgi:Ribbon-helix-helix protein, copG family
MSATRTQIYLTEEQRRRIDDIAASEGVPMAEVVRRALDAYTANEIDADAVLARTYGAQPDAEVPSRQTWKRG